MPTCFLTSCVYFTLTLFFCNTYLNLNYYSHPIFCHLEFLYTWTICPWNTCLPTSLSYSPVYKIWHKKIPVLAMMSYKYLPSSIFINFLYSHKTGKNMLKISSFNRLFQSGFRFAEQLNAVHRDSHTFPALTHAQPQTLSPPVPEWYICYNWWIFIDTSSSPKVHSLW